MDRKKLIRRIRTLGRKRGIKVKWVAKRGKGGHGTIYYGNKKTILAKREFSNALVRKICTQLGIDPKGL